MFWKKKISNALTVELNSHDRRNGVRIQPLDKIVIHSGHQQYELIDISSIGLAFKLTAPDIFKKGDNLEVSFPLPQLKQMSVQGAAQPGSTQPEPLIACTITVLQIKHAICHCNLLQIGSDEQKLLDQFILNEQKRQIRNL